MFIDYGNTCFVMLNDLRELTEGLLKTKPPQAMECVLSNIKPSQISNPRGIWSDTINDMFDSVTNGCTLYGQVRSLKYILLISLYITHVIVQVYSVVDGVVYLELYKQLPRIHDMENKSLNQWLIEKGYADHAEESYLSKVRD